MVLIPPTSKKPKPMSETIRPEKRQALVTLMKQLGVREEDLVEKFILGGGPGGQKINKASTCVQLRHIPSGLEVKVQQSRSREMNRFFARRLLCEKLAARQQGVALERLAEAARIRRQKQRRSRRQKARLLEVKHHRAAIKAGRRSIATDAEE